MAVSSVTNTNTTTNSSTSITGTRNTGELGKDQFMQLLVTQLKYQNPLDPMDDKEFVAQMAQFSSLEQMQNLNSNVSSMRAFTLMGKNISAQYTDDDSGEDVEISGIVDKVKIESGNTYVEVDGKDVPIDKITNISDNNVSKITDLMTMVGKNAEAQLTNSDGYSIYVGGQVAGVRKIAGVDYAQLSDVELIDADVVLPSNSKQYKKDYLDANIGKLVTVTAQDSLGNEVEVTGKLVSAEENGDRFDIILDNVTVPVEDITGIVQ